LLLRAHLDSMEKAARAQMLRQRFKATVGLAYVPSGNQRHCCAG